MNPATKDAEILILKTEMCALVQQIARLEKELIDGALTLDYVGVVRRKKELHQLDLQRNGLKRQLHKLED